MTINSSRFLTLLLTLSQVTPAAGEGLLRLFTTAQERAALNAERLKLQKPSIEKKPARAIIPPKPPNYITFNGLIRVNNREPIVWINNSTDIVQQGFRVELTEELSVVIILSNSQQRIILKPGQTLNTLNGTIK
jgi:hypothetical protein